MKKFTLFLLFSLLSLVFLHAQPCLQQGITFTTQSDIDNFQADYPGCHEIGGEVNISGDGITSLAGLRDLTKIDGDLSIYSNTSLVNMEGLDHLTTVLGSVNISGNDLFTDLFGLNGLRYVGGTWTILYHNNLIDFSGLNALKFIGGDLQIVINPALASLAGLESLDSIGGTLFIYGNSSLANLSGLISLTSLGGDLAIQYNPALPSLTGLDNIIPGSISNLSISGNAELSACAVTSICGYLANPFATASISNNATGCNNTNEVEQACKSVSADDLQSLNTVAIYPNPCRGNFTLMTGNVVTATEMTIYNYLGQKMDSWNLKGNKVDVSCFSKGIYFVIIQQARDLSRSKIVVY